MLEGIVATILAKYLGEYVVGLEKENLKLNLTGGKVTLENLALNRDALSDLDLPLEIRDGTLQRLYVDIPWKSLGSKPAVITIDGLRMVIKARGISTPEEEAKRAQRTKERRLRLDELFTGSPTDDDEKAKAEAAEKKKSDSFTSRLITKVVDNLQLFVNNIHIRYEDDVSSPGHPFSAGIVLESLHAQSTDEQFKPVFISSPQQLIHKLVTLRNFAVYFNTNDLPLEFSSAKEMAAGLDGLLAAGKSGPTAPRYIINPISGSLKAILNKSDIPNMNIPKLFLSFAFDQLALSLEDWQYRDLLCLVESLTNFNKIKAHSAAAELRPIGKRIRDAPREWWGYAIEAVRRQCRERRRRWTWAYIKQRRDDRNRYVALWKKKRLHALKKTKAAPKLTPAEESEVEALEQKLAYEDIVLFRQLGNAAVKIEIQREEKLKEQKKASSSATSGGGGFFSRLWSRAAASESRSTSSDELARPEGDEHGFSSDVWREIYAAIDYDESKAESGAATPTAVPRDWVKTRVHFELERTSLELRDSANGGTPVVRAALTGLTASFDSREGSSAIGLQIAAVRLSDFHTLGSAAELPLLAPLPTVGLAKSVLSIRVEVNPLDGHADVAVGVDVQPVVATFSRPLIERITTFFASTTSTALGDIQLAAYNTLDRLRESAQTQVKYALDTRKKIDVRVDAAAPVVLVPQNFTEPDCPMLVVDLGRITLRSDLAARRDAVETISAVVSGGPEKEKRAPATATASGVSAEEEFFYDKFSLKMSNLRAALISKSRDWREKLDRSHTLVNEFDIEVSLGLLTVPTNVLPKVTVSGQLPNVELLISVDKARRLLKALQGFGQSRPATSAAAPDDVVEPAEPAKQPRRSAGVVEGDTAAADRQVFRGSFSMGGVSLLVHDANKDILRVDISKFSASLLKTQWAMDADVRLGGILVDDRIQPYGSDFSELVASKKGEDFITVAYHGRTRDSPRFAGVEHDVSVAFNALTVMINRSTLIALMDIATSITATEGAVATPSPPPAKPPSRPVSKRMSTMVQPQQAAALAAISKPATPNVLMLKAAVKLGSLTLILNKEGARFASAILSDSAVQVDIADAAAAMTVTGMLGGITVEDLSTPNTKWPEIVRITGQRMVAFTFETSKTPGRLSAALEGDFRKAFLGASSGSLARADQHLQNWKDTHGIEGETIVQAHVASVQVVALMKFVDGLQSYISELSKMQQLWESTRSTVAAAASAVAVQARATRKLLHFNIHIDSPTIIMPAGSNAAEPHLRFDLGNIHLSNRLLWKPSARGDAVAIVDSLNVAVQTLNLKAVDRVDANMSTSYPVIRETDITLMVTRPSFLPLPHTSPTAAAASPIAELLAQREIEQNFKEIPDIDVTCSIPHIAVCISDDPLRTILRILQGNLQDGPRSSARTESAELTDLRKSIGADGAVAAAAPSPIPPTVATAEEVPPIDKTKLYASFTLNTFSVDVSRGSAAEFASVLSFTITKLGGAVSMATNGSLQAEVGLQSIVLDDLRPDSPNLFRHLLDRAYLRDSRQVDVRFRKSAAGELDVTVVVDGPRVQLVPEAIFSMKNFILPLIEETTRALDSLKGPTMTTELPKKEVSRPAAGGAAKMRVSLSVAEATVLTLEDPTQSETRAVVGQVSVDVTYAVGPSAMATLAALGATQDTTHVGVTRLALQTCRAVAGEHAKVIAAQPLIDNTAVNVELRRNVNLPLSSDAAEVVDILRKLPDMEIQSNIPAFGFAITEEQLDVTLAVVQRNVEVVNRFNPPAATTADVTATPSPATAATAPESDRYIDRPKLRAEANLGRFAVELLRGNGVTASGMPSSVTAFVMEGLRVAVSMATNGDMTASVGLHTIALNDTRGVDTTSNKFRQLLDRAYARETNQIEVQYSKKQAAQTVSLLIDGPRVQLVPEALFSLKAFVEPLVSKVTGTLAAMGGGSSAKPAASSNAQSGSMHVDVDIREATILVLEDPLITRPRCLLGQVSTRIEYHTTKPGHSPLAQQDHIVVRTSQLTLQNGYALQGEHAAISDTQPFIDRVRIDVDMWRHIRASGADAAATAEPPSIAALPDMDIKVDVPEFIIAPTDYQLDVILSVAKETYLQLAKYTATQQPPATAPVAAPTERPSITHGDGVVRTSLSANVALGKFAVELLRADSANPSDSTHARPIVAFAIGRLATRVAMSTDGSLTAEVAIGTISVDDLRRDSPNRFTHLLDRAYLRDTNQIEVEYRKAVTKTTTNQSVTVAVDGPRVQFVPEAIFAIKGAIDEVVSRSLKSLEAFRASSSAVPPATTGTGVRGVDVTQEMTVTVKVREATVLLLADPTAQTTNTLLSQLSVDLQYHVGPEANPTGTDAAPTLVTDQVRVSLPQLTLQTGIATAGMHAELSALRPIIERIPVEVDIARIVGTTDPEGVLPMAKPDMEVSCTIPDISIALGDEQVRVLLGVYRTTMVAMTTATQPPPVALSAPTVDTAKPPTTTPAVSTSGPVRTKLRAKATLGRFAIELIHDSDGRAASSVASFVITRLDALVSMDTAGGMVARTALQSMAVNDTRNVHSPNKFVHLFDRAQPKPTNQIEVEYRKDPATNGQFVTAVFDGPRVQLIPEALFSLKGYIDPVLAEVTTTLAAVNSSSSTPPAPAPVVSPASTTTDPNGGKTPMSIALSVSEATVWLLEDPTIPETRALMAQMSVDIRYEVRPCPVSSLSTATPPALSDSRQDSLPEMEGVSASGRRPFTFREIGTDVTKVTLSGLSLSTCRIFAASGESTYATARDFLPIIRHFGVDVDMIRPLIPTTAMPDMDIKCRMPDFTIAIAEEHFKQVFAIVHGLREAQRVAAASTPTALPPPTSTVAATVTPAAAERPNVNMVVSTSTLATPTVPCRTKLRARLDVARLAVELLRGDGRPATEAAPPPSVPSLVVDEISSEFRQCTDDTAHAEAGIRAVALVDTRPESANQFRQLLDRPPGRNDRLVDVRYDKEFRESGGLQTVVKATLDSPRVQLVAEALLHFKAFVDPIVSMATESLRSPATAPSGPVPTAPLSTPSETAALPMLVELDIRDTTMWLLEQPTQPDTRSVVAKLSTQLAYETSPIDPSTVDPSIAELHGRMQTHIGLRVQGLQVFKCRRGQTMAANSFGAPLSLSVERSFSETNVSSATADRGLNEAEERAKRVPIVRPFDVAMEMRTGYVVISSANEPAAAAAAQSENTAAIKRVAPSQLIEVTVAPADVIISYNDVKLFLAIWDNIQAVLPKKEEGPSSPGSAASGDSTSHTPGEPSDSSMALAAASSSTVPTVPSTTGEVVQHLTGKAGKLQLLLINDMFQLDDSGLDGGNGYSVPLARVDIDEMLLEASGWGSGPELRTAAAVGGLRVDFFNTDREAWEPVVEPWRFKLGLQRTRLPPVTRATVHSDAVVNVTVSTAFVRHVLQWRDTFGEDLKRERAIRRTTAAVRGESQIRAEWHPFFVRNETGVALRYWLARAAPREIATGTEAPLDLWELETANRVQALHRADGNAAAAAAGITVEIGQPGQFAPLRNVPINRVHVVYLKLKPPTAATDSQSPAAKPRKARNPTKDRIEVACDVSYRGGAKVITFRSPIVLRNDTELTVQVLAEPATATTATPAATATADSAFGEIDMPPVPPRSSLAIPLGVMYRAASLRLRPMGYPYEWSVEGVSVATLKKEVALAAKRGQKALAEAERSTVAAVPGLSLSFNPSTAVTAGAGTKRLRPRLRWRLRCAASESQRSEYPPFLYHVFQEYSEKEGNRDVSLALRPPLAIENLLPVRLNFRIANLANDKDVITSGIIDKGECAEIYQLDLTQASLGLNLQIAGFHWSQAPYTIAEKGKLSERHKDGDNIPAVELHDVDTNRPLKLRVATTTSGGDGHSRRLCVYADYWLVNNTAFPDLVFSEKKAGQLAAGQQSRLALLAEIGTTAESIAVSTINPETQFQEISRRHPELWQPLVFGHPKTAVRMNNTDWSKSIPLTAQRSSGMVSLLGYVPTAADAEAGQSAPSDPLVTHKGKETRHHHGNDRPSSLFDFGVTINPAPGKFWRTKVVTVSPRFVLINNMGGAIRLRYEPLVDPKSVTPAAPATAAYSLNDGDQVPLYWPLHSSDNIHNSVGEKRYVRLKLDFTEPGLAASGDDTGWAWSSPIPVDQVNTFAMALHSTSGIHRTLITVDVKAAAGEATLLVVVGRASERFPPYRIVNRSRRPITVSQKDCGIETTVNKGDSLPFAWDDPVNAPKVLTVRADTVSTLVIMEKLRKLKDMKISDEEHLKMQVMADGPTKVLNIIDRRDQRKRRPKKKPDKSKGKDKEKETESTKHKYVSLDVAVSLAGMGVSVIDNAPQELVYLSIMGVLVGFAIAPDVDTSLELTIADMHIDNSLLLTPYPIVWWSKPPQDKKMIHLSVVKSTQREHAGLDYFRYVAFSMQEADIRIDEVFLLRMLKFWEQLSDILQTQSVKDAEVAALLGSGRALAAYYAYDWAVAPQVLAATSRNASTAPAPAAAAAVAKGDAAAPMIYFELFHLNPIKANLSFRSVESAADYSGLRERDGDRSTLEVLLSAGGLLANIEDAPLQLNGLVLKHAFSSKPDLIARVTRHYVRQGVTQVYRILGSADFLGNPVSLVSNLGTGVYDFFHEPAKGLVTSPKEFGKGIAKGTASLLKRSVFALFNTTSKITGTLADTAVKLSTNRDWQRERDRLAMAKPRHIGEGVIYGVRDFGFGVVNAFAGLIVEPVKGARAEGGLGLLKGMGRGLTGVVLRPVVGTVDLVTRTTEGIKNTTTYFDERKRTRVRPPRYIGPEKVIEVYSHDKSLGQEILRTVEGGRYEMHYYMHHVPLDAKWKKLVLVSDRAVFGIKAGSKTTQPRDMSVEWRVKIRDVAMIEYQKNTLTIVTLTGGQKHKIKLDEPAKTTLYQKLREVVREWRYAHWDERYERLEELDRQASVPSPSVVPRGVTVPAIEEISLEDEKGKTTVATASDAQPGPSVERPAPTERTALLGRDETSEKASCKCCVVI